MSHTSILNDITLQFLISKEQLQKLNQKRNTEPDTSKVSQQSVHEDKIKELFHNLLVNEAPDDLTYELRNIFDLFVDKCIAYFEDKEQEKERKEQQEQEQEQEAMDIEGEEDAEEEINL